MTRYCRIVSWHVATGIVSRGAQIQTRCGRWAPADAPQSDHLPGDEPTCERCAVLTLRDEGSGDVDNAEVPA